jgi:hypothetical protein
MKATRATVRQRVESVMKLRLLGAEFHDLRAFANEEDAETGRPWNVSDRQLWRYCHQADALLEKNLEKDKGKLFARHIGQRRALYARAMESGDWKAALAILKDEAELLGLYPIKPANGKDQGNVINIFQRIEQHAERLRINGSPAELADGLPRIGLSGDGEGKSLAQAPADAEAG